MKEYKIKTEEFDKLIKLLKIENPICKYCKKPLTKENFAIIMQKGHCCSDEFCLIHHFAEEEKDGDK